MHTPLVEQIASLGVELNANQYKVVRLAAEYDTTLDWFHEGFKSSAVAIASALDIHDSTAREWIRVGHALDELPLIHEAFATNDLSYAKTRILTRWADSENEADLLALAYDRTANRLTTAIASYLADDETDEERDLRQHEERSVTVHTDANGMVIIRMALPANIGKPVAAALDTVIKQVAATPFEESSDESSVTSTSTSSTTSAAPESSVAELTWAEEGTAEADVERALWASSEASRAAYSATPPDPQYPALISSFTGRELTRLQADIADMLRLGQFFMFPEESDTTIDFITMLDAESAMVQVCEVDRGELHDASGLLDDAAFESEFQARFVLERGIWLREEQIRLNFTELESGVSPSCAQPDA